MKLDMLARRNLRKQMICLYEKRLVSIKKIVGDKALVYYVPKTEANPIVTRLFEQISPLEVDINLLESLDEQTRGTVLDGAQFVLTKHGKVYRVMHIGHELFKQGGLISLDVQLYRSFVYENAVIQGNVILRNTIVCDNAQVIQHASSEIVLKNSFIQDKAVLNSYINTRASLQIHARDYSELNLSVAVKEPIYIKGTMQLTT